VGTDQVFGYGVCFFEKRGGVFVGGGESDHPIAGLR